VVPGMMVDRRKKTHMSHETAPDAADDLRVFIQMALDGIILMDLEGRITEFNPAAEQIFGYTRAQVVGHPLADCLIPSALRAAHQAGIARYLATGHTSDLGQRL